MTNIHKLFTKNFFSFFYYSFLSLLRTFFKKENNLGEIKKFFLSLIFFECIKNFLGNLKYDCLITILSFLDPSFFFMFFWCFFFVRKGINSTQNDWQRFAVVLLPPQGVENLHII